MDRRDFLKLTGFAAIPVFTPQITAWAVSPQRIFGDDSAKAAAFSNRVLVLVELQGGNDGLNTVVPFAHDEYYRLRPTLAVPRENVVRLDDSVGLAPQLQPLSGAWQDEDLAVVQGVGYENPNRSHFRSIEIWETGSDADEYLQDGWVSRVLKGTKRPEGLAADGIVLGRTGLGPLNGPGLRNVAMDNPATFARQARAMRKTSGATNNPALAHILGVKEDIREAARIIEKQHRRIPALAESFPRGRLGQQLRLAAELLMSKVPVSVIKVGQNGYDTHSGQRGRHNGLLTELGRSLAAFRDAMKKARLWDDVLVMTYSEFGRRAAENASGGTDHGTAAPQLVMGGQVRGGLHGEHPSLEKLQRYDLVHTTDFRRLHATIANDWWHLPAGRVDAKWRSIDCIGRKATF